MGILYSVLIYIAVSIFFIGVSCKLWRYTRTPVPLRMPTTPAPLTRRGVALRLLRELLLFHSLFKASRWTWIFAWLFHAGLLFILLVHLQYFIQPVWAWVVLLLPYSTYAACAMMLGLAGLLLRRLLVDRVRYISTPSDYLMLILLLCIGASGLLMRHVWYANVGMLREFALGLSTFEFNALPAHLPLLVHLLLVVILLLVFPFSKLLHAPGLFFSPSRNQADTAREKPHG